MGEAAPSQRDSSLPSVAQPLSGDAFAAWCAFGSAGRRWARHHLIRALPGICPAGRGCALPFVAQPLPGDACAACRLRPRRPALGPDPVHRPVGSDCFPQRRSALVSQPVATSSGQAGAGLDRTQVGSLPYSGFAWQRAASPSPLPNGLAWRRPCSLVCRRQSRQALGQTPLEASRGSTRPYTTT